MSAPEAFLTGIVVALVLQLIGGMLYDLVEWLRKKHRERQ